MKRRLEIMDICSREVLDSRGNPTVEVEVLLNNGAKGGTEGKGLKKR